MAAFGISVEGVVGKDPGSDANFSMLTQWIEECVTTHERCCSGFPLLTSVRAFQRPLPTRLIDVSNSQSAQCVSLSETAGQIGSYITLSHCWGSSGDPSWKTTLATLEDKKRSIDLASLPKMYQDAITITWKLGQRYLWVDSLCIIQDSTEDWNREAAVMGHIYEHSVFTICGSGQESSHVACLARREPGPFDPVILEPQAGGQKSGRVHIYRRIYSHRVARNATGLFYANVDQSPLASRAWVIQERTLSPRNIHYGKEQIFWECLSKRYAEGGSRFISSATHGYIVPTVTDRYDPEVPRAEKPSQGYLKSSRWYIYWYHIVEFYTARKLTRSTDKLPALSGLATETQKKTGDQYLAGLWSTCLHHGLAWRVAADSPSTRPPFYRAPSWSWAAIDGPVTYNASFFNFVRPEDILPAIDVLDVHVVPAGLNKLGEVTAGWIKLAGQLKIARFKRSHPTSVFESCHPDASVTESIGDYYDDAKQIWDNKELYCLRLSIFPVTEGPGIPTPHPVLVLQPVSDLAGQYRRVGSGTIWNTYWFDDCPKTTITIV